MRKTRMPLWGLLLLILFPGALRAGDGLEAFAQERTAKDKIEVQEIEKRKQNVVRDTSSSTELQQAVAEPGKLRSGTFNVNGWPRRSVPIRICTTTSDFTDPSNGKVYSLSATGLSTLRTWVFDALDRSWGQVPGLSFVDAGACSAASGEAIRLTLWNAPGVFGGCGPTAIDCELAGPEAQFSTAQTETEIKQAGVHELGHGLGLAHEHQMPGRAPLCPAEQAIYDGCKACVGGTCADTDFTRCFLFSSGSNPATLDQDQINLAQSRIDNRTVDVNATVLTLYDPISLMNYCSAANGRDPSSFMPTLLDLLGMEMLYPANRVYPVGCENGCVLTAGGAIVRTDGSVTSDWTGRGALSILMRRSGSTTDESFVKASALPNGSSTFSYTFKDPRGTQFKGGGTVVKSDPAHTAVVMNLFSCL